MATNILPAHEYTKRYAEVLVKEFPDVSFSIVDEKIIDARFNGSVARLSVDNAYLAYQSNPDSLSQIMDSYVTSLRSSFTQSEKITLENIVPVIKPVSFLNAATNMGAPAGSIGIHEMYNDELIVLYAADLPNNVRGIKESDLTSLGITKESLREIAINNLAKLLTNIQLKGGNGLFMVIANGSYESSIILLDNVIHQKNFQVNGDLVIAIPNRDILLITGSYDTQNVAKVAAITNKMFTENNYPISPFIFKRMDNKWERWAQ